MSLPDDRLITLPAAFFRTFDLCLLLLLLLRRRVRLPLPLPLHLLLLLLLLLLCLPPLFPQLGFTGG